MNPISNNEKEQVRVFDSSDSFCVAESQFISSGDNMTLSAAILRTVPNSMPSSGVLVFDHSMRFLLAEGTVFRRSGLLPENVEGKTLHQVVPEDRLGALPSIYKQTLEGRVQEIPYESSNRHYLLRTAPVKVGEDIVAGMITLEDVTVREHLLHDLKIRAEEAEIANEEVERFAFAVAHDMKAPLRTITTYLELLSQGGFFESEDSDSQVWYSYIMKAAQKLSNRVKYLLKYSRISRHSPANDVIDIQKVVKDTCQECGILEHVVVGEMPEISGDSVLMCQLLENLLSNASKYRSPERDLEVHVRGRNEDGFFVLTVKDNGIGFDNKHNEKIFDFFERLHTEEEGFPGEGMGLAICKRIAEIHHGKIKAFGVPGKGAEFKIYFPCA